MRFSRNFITSYVSVDLHTRTTGHLVYRSYPIKYMVHRLHVYYIIYRKNHFVSLGQVRSILVVRIFLVNGN